MLQAIEVRPYQVLCLFCAVGRETAAENGGATQRLRAAIRADDLLHRAATDFARLDLARAPGRGPCRVLPYPGPREVPADVSG